MRCLASSKKSDANKIINDSKMDVMEYVITATAFVFLEKFNYSDKRTHFIMQRINYYAGIMTDTEEDIDLQMYTDILKTEYDFVINIKGANKDIEKYARGANIKNATANVTLNYALTIVAYVLFDKFGLKRKRVETILKRIVYYANPIIEKDDKVTVQKYRDVLKQKYDFNLIFYR